MTASDGCIDGDTALAFAQGRLSGDRLASVDEHLDGCGDCRWVVAEAVKALRGQENRDSGGDGDGDAWRPEPATRLPAGSLLADRYFIVRFIARGGMGEVYEAEDRLLNQRIALKTLLPAISEDQRAVQRFKFEANFARRITHPNVCRIFDVGVHQERGPGQKALFFITMELVVGVSLGQRLRKEGRLSADAALPVVKGMVAALAAAHRVGVIHRDFKSDNVMLESSDGAQRVVVMDFGLARATATEMSSAQITNPSASGGLVGTVAYMAPEQVEGRALTPATDIYALGVVMFELVTGRLPFVGEGTLDVAARRLLEPAPEARSLVPDLDPKWNAAIKRCLEQDAARRFRRVEDVVDVLAGGASAETKAPPTRSRRMIAVGTAAGIALGTTGLVLSGVLPRGPRPLPPVVTADPPPPSSAPAMTTSAGALDAAPLRSVDQASASPASDLAPARPVARRRDRSGSGRPAAPAPVVEISQPAEATGSVPAADAQSGAGADAAALAPRRSLDPEKGVITP